MKAFELSQEDVRRVVRLLGEVAGHGGGIVTRKKFLMDGLAELVGADDWVWAISPEAGGDEQSVFTSFVHGGISEERMGFFMRALEHPDLKRLNGDFLREVASTERHLTRTQEQLDPVGFFAGCDARSLWDSAGLSEVMLSFRPIRERMMSGVALYRRSGERPFSAREARIAHVILTEVPWLHEAGWSEDAALEVPRLSPRRRTVLNLVLEGLARKSIAAQLGISEHTLGGYVKDIFRHFGVHSQAELIARFRRGDGHDTPEFGD
jgi:DNA-binding CsgD family transcriptional regulator